jgi:acetolactate synthase-1/2/3 large subunit
MPPLHWKGLSDFVKLAEAYGAVGMRATKPEEVVPTLKRPSRPPSP